MEARMTYHDRVFLAPLARRDRIVDHDNLDAIIEWEFSEELRDPRFLPGWYILPGLAVAGLLIIIAMFA
jgi:hypothetical protein